MTRSLYSSAQVCSLALQLSQRFSKSQQLRNCAHNKTPVYSETVSVVNVRVGLKVALAELEEASPESPALAATSSHRATLLVFLDTTSSRGLQHWAFQVLFSLPLQSVAEAPLTFSAGAGLLNAALLDVGRSALLSSENL